MSPEDLAPGYGQPDPRSDFDVIIIGAGIGGLYQLYRLRELGLSVRLLEAGGGVGGTWYWNRYPGARLDSESYTYGYFFSDELWQEWSWSEEFVGQPELERYFNFVVDRFGMRPDIELNARVSAANYDEKSNRWTVHTADDRQLRAQFLITAVGILSAPQFPIIPGLEEFEGEWHHTAMWPVEPVDFTGKRVAVLGTGSSGVQLIAAISQDVASMVVFQRTPNWATPINNLPITQERATEIRQTAAEIYRLCRETTGGFKHRVRPQSAMEVSAEERREYYERLFNAPGLTMYQANFQDLIISKEANDTVVEFLSQKIRERVSDPQVVAKLIPTDHGYAMKRPPLETNYYEVYNQDNVSLISLADEPIKRFTPTGIDTELSHYDVDIIVFATGFDAVTGSLTRIDFRGVGGKSLREYWADGPRTYLGFQTTGFPNLFIIGGPQVAGGNNPRMSEAQVDWVTDCLRYLREHGYQRMEATASAEEEWAELASHSAAGTLQEGAASWYFGANTPGKKRTFLLYAGGQPAYRARCDEVAENGYAGFTLRT